MSRIGKKPVAVPDSVTVSVSGSEVSVKGPKGELSWGFPPGISVQVDDDGRLRTRFHALRWRAEGWHADGGQEESQQSGMKPR